MATTTPNFGWAVPTSTDLVKDGAVAIETLGDAIDASLVDLKGGTTGQVLSKTSNTDMDFTWVAPTTGDITGVTAGTGISGGGTSGDVTITNSMATAIDAKGDLIAGTGADAFSRLAVGTNGQYLQADSTTATGLKWATVSTSPSFVGALAYASSLSMSMTSGGMQAINLAAEEFDTDGFHSTSTNTNRMTIPSGKAGKYLLTATLDINGITGNTYYIVQFRKNGTALTGMNRGFSGNAGGNTFQGGSLATIVDAAVGDYYEVGYQEGNTETITMWCRFGIQYLGA